MWEENVDKNSRKKAEIPSDLAFESSGVKDENDESRCAKQNQPCPNSTLPVGVSQFHGYLS